MQTSNRPFQFYGLHSESDIARFGLDAFAASFGHSINRLFPIWVAMRDGRMLGYCYLHPQMILYPAIHPSITPKEFYRVAWEWFSQIKPVYGDPLLVADPVSMPKATPGLLSKVGLEPFPNVYKVRD